MRNRNSISKSNPTSIIYNNYFGLNPKFNRTSSINLRFPQVQSCSYLIYMLNVFHKKRNGEGVGSKSTFSCHVIIFRSKFYKSFCAFLEYIFSHFVPLKWLFHHFLLLQLTPSTIFLSRYVTLFHFTLLYPINKQAQRSS